MRRPCTAPYTRAPLGPRSRRGPALSLLQPEPRAPGSALSLSLSLFGGPACPTHRAAILQNGVCEPAVALSPDLHIVGALDEQSLLEVASSFVQVGNAVLAVVGDVLRALGGQQAESSEVKGV